MYLDDKGRGIDDMRLIVAELFPLDREITEKKMEGWVHLMATVSVGDDEPALCRYEVAGRRFLHAPKWRDHQTINRPQASRLPPCPFHDGSRNDSVNEAVNDSVSESRSVHGAFTVGKEGKGKEGKGREKNTAAANAGTSPNAGTGPKDAHANENGKTDSTRSPRDVYG